MDIPAHIIDAVHNDPPTIQMEQTKPSRQHSPNRVYPQYKDYKGFQSSADDVSSASISEPDHGYNTEPTTPASSQSRMEDMSTDEVEDFKDREYPQLKGKTYLDHGGTTVRGPKQGVQVCVGDSVLMGTLSDVREITRGGILRRSHWKLVWQPSFSFVALGSSRTPHRCDP